MALLLPWRATLTDVVMTVDPPIKSIGIKGIRLAAREIVKWLRLFGDHELRVNLFNLRGLIEIGETDGGSFRTMYARLPGEATAATGNKRLEDSAKRMQLAGEVFSRIGSLAGDARDDSDGARDARAREVMVEEGDDNR